MTGVQTCALPIFRVECVEMRHAAAEPDEKAMLGFSERRRELRLHFLGKSVCAECGRASSDGRAPEKVAACEHALNHNPVLNLTLLPTRFPQREKTIEPRKARERGAHWERRHSCRRPSIAPEAHTSWKGGGSVRAGETADQALKYADRAIELYGATGEMLDTRARILISAGKYDRAVADLNDAIGQGGTPLRFFHLALAQLRMQKPDQALQTFREARARGLDPKSIHPNDLPTYKALLTRADAVQ